MLGALSPPVPLHLFGTRRNTATELKESPWPFDGDRGAGGWHPLEGLATYGCLIEAIPRQRSPVISRYLRTLSSIP